MWHSGWVRDDEMDGVMGKDIRGLSMLHVLVWKGGCLERKGDCCYTSDLLWTSQQSMYVFEKMSTVHATHTGLFSSWRS